ncbi:MFS transporter [Polyangium sp. y55x31]|uniref:MFS transporter n=1 Tax=Polyangium sp. y55x31 TaxID=3042688 RepID=UPI002482938B|nr:MFS transporter [Polyangium sp. y55x31]MDI1480354.1 MFS transporter [Polyangium sp. y55x31]
MERTASASVRVSSSRSFWLLWSGQCASLIGSGLTTFSVGVHIFQATRSITRFALVALAGALPGVLASPLLGVLVDRHNRRSTMMLADALGGAATAVLFVGAATGRLTPSFAYTCTAILSVCASLQWAAYGAAVTQLIPQDRLSRANGAVQAGEAIAQIVAPVLAGALLPLAGLRVILLVDLVSYMLAIATAAAAWVPDLPLASRSRGASDVRREVASALRYLRVRPGLLSLMALLAANNFVLGVLQPLLTPLVLGFASPRALGTTLTLSALGMLAGGIAVAAWGGSRRPIDGILLFTAIGGVGIFAGALRPAVAWIAMGGFVLMFSAAIVVASSQTVWQRQVSPAMQGRVFALRRAIALLSWPLGALFAGPVAEFLFEPWLQPGGALAGSLGRVISVGPGRGVAALYLLLGCVLVLIAVVGSLSRPLRRLDGEAPAEPPDLTSGA